MKTSHLVVQFEIGFNPDPDSTIMDCGDDFYKIENATGCEELDYSFGGEPDKVWFSNNETSIRKFKDAIAGIKLKHIEIIYINNVYEENERVMDTRIDFKTVQGRALLLA